MDVATVSGVSAAANAGDGVISKALGQAGGALGKNEFLNMLVTQMKNQDPLDPVKNEDMIAQLAQFSSLEQMQNLNSSFASYRSESAMLAAAQWGGQLMGFEMKDGTAVEGTVDGVWTLDGVTYLQVGESSIAMKDIAKVSWPAPAEGAAAEGAVVVGETVPAVPVP
jgi:flagellar basal-body rod modification protein FlgD